MEKRKGLETVEAKQFGNLHERMMYLVRAAQEDEKAVPHKVWDAIWDLKTEVEHYRPVDPPFGQRTK